MKDITRWFGVQPTEPEQVFTHFEPPYGCTYVHASGEIVANNTDIYTVPADKKLYLVSYWLSVWPNSGAGWGQLRVVKVPPGILATLSFLDRLADDGITVIGNLNIALEVAPLYKVNLISQNAAVTAYGGFTGYTRNA